MKRALWPAAGIGAIALAAGYFLAPAGTQSGGNAGGKKGCELVVTSPAFEAGGVLKLVAGDSLNVTLQGTALRCPSTTVTVYSKVGGAEETELGTTSTSGTGTWSYGVTATDATTTVVRLAMTSQAGTTTSTSVSLVADSTKPKILVTSPAPDDWGRVRIVAAAADAGCGSGGNKHADLGEPGWVYDQSCAAGGQVNPSITVTGGSPGTLTVQYADAGIASVAISSSPQTFTSAELGQWTLPEWSRSDLIITATGPGGTTTKTIMGRVATVTPPELMGPNGLTGPLYEIKDNRKTLFDVSFLLPQPPPEVNSASITIAWTTSTRLMTPDVDLGSVALTEVPTALPAIPDTCEVLMVANAAAADAGTPAVYCALDNPNPGNDAGVRLNPYGPPWVTNRQIFSVGLPDAGLTSNRSGCGSGGPQATVYCVAEGSKSVTATASGCCYERTQALFDDPTKAGKVPVCQYYDGAWTCIDTADVYRPAQGEGTTHAPGEAFTLHLQHIAPLNTVYFNTELSW